MFIIINNQVAPDGINSFLSMFLFIIMHFNYYYYGN